MKKKKNSGLKKIASIMLAVMMVFTMMPSMALAEVAPTESTPTESGTPTDGTPTDSIQPEGGETGGTQPSESEASENVITVKVRSQDEYAFNYINDELEVRAGIAGEYGFDNDEKVSPGTITALDVLVAAHIDKYKTEFVKAKNEQNKNSNANDYLSMKNGNPVEMFGNDNSTKYSGFAINHGYAMDPNKMGYNVNTAPVNDGDVIDFFYYEDPYWCDILAWFENSSGTKLDVLTVDEGDSVSLSLKGFIFMYGSNSPTPSNLLDSADSYITIFDGNNNLVFESGNTDTPLKENGTFSVTFDKAGKYYLTAQGGDGNDSPILSPYITIDVRGKDYGFSVSNNTISPTFAVDTKAYNIENSLASTANLSVNWVFSDSKQLKAVYNDSTGKDKEVKVQSGKNTSLSNIKAGETDIEFRFYNSFDLANAADTYTLKVKKLPGIKSLTVKSADGTAIDLDKSFDPKTTSYSFDALIGSTVSFNAVCDDVNNTELFIKKAGEDNYSRITNSSSYTIGSEDTVYTIKAKSKDGKTESGEYVFNVNSIEASNSTLSVTEGSIVSVHDPYGNPVNLSSVKQEGGKDVYTLSKLLSGKEYTYRVSKYGYNTETGTFTAAADETDNVSVELEEAVAPTSSITSEWSNFRNSESNMAFVSADTPKTPEETKLKWSQRDASGNMSPGTYIIVDGKIVYTSGNKLSLIDKETGKIVKSVKMYASKGFSGYMPPVYGGGMIYVTLNGGIVQAFDAKTLESCWIYKDEIGGQPLSAIMYDNGYLYTGFSSNSATKYNNFVCISATDEYKTTGTEEKYATWTYKHLGGFYWSGAYIDENFAVVGADNGALFVFDKKTGEVKDREEVDGDIRCSIAEKDGTLYFVTKNGKFYSATISSSGEITLDTPITFGGQSTSTPVVVNDYAYIGVNNKTVAQIKISDGTVKTISTNAYPQASMLVNTADSENTYLYFTCNAKPGGIYIIKVNNTTGEMTLDELYKPETSKQQFCIASVMCDESGNLYYYNDSGNLFALEKVAVSSAKYELSFKVTDVGGSAIEGANIAVTSMDNAAIEITANDGVYTLSPGEYKYEIEKDGYKTASGTVNVTNSNMTVPISLQAESTTPGQPIEQTVKIQVIGCDGQANYPEQTLEFREGMTAISVLQAIAGDSLEWKNTQYGAYVVGIDGLSEFDKGPQSGWMYKVNGSFPSYSAGEYKLKAGDQVVWVYTTDLGADVGNAFAPVETTQPVTQDVTAVVNKDGEATSKVSSSDVDKLVDAAVKQSANTIEVNVKGADKADKVSVELPKDSVKKIADKTDASLQVTTPAGNVIMDKQAMKEAVNAASGSDLTIVLDKQDIADASKEPLGSTAAQTKVSILSGGKEIKDLGTAKVKILLPVSDAMKDKAMAAATVDEDGKLTKTDGKLVTVNGKTYYQIETSKPGAFVVAESANLDAAIKAQAAETDDEKQARIIKGVQDTTIKITKTSKGKGWIKINWRKSKGYKVDYYEVFRKTGKNSKFGKTAFYKTKKHGLTGYYKNTKALKKGKRYYYKVRGVRVIDGKKYYTKWSNTRYRIAK